MNNHAIAIFGEIIAIDQRLRGKLTKVMPKSMELSHFSVLHHLATGNAERTPAQLAKTLGVSRAAMSNTLTKLEAKGYVHIRPDWEDARQKYISISEAGRFQRDQALKLASPLFEDSQPLQEGEARKLLGMLREIREDLSD